MKERLLEAMRESAIVVGLLLGLAALFGVALLVGFGLKALFHLSMVAGVIGTIVAVFVFFTAFILFTEGSYPRRHT